AGSGGPFAGTAVNILLVNWQDRENPFAGGAEVHLFEVYRRLALGGHRVRLLCSGWRGASRRASVDGVEVHRVGGRRSFALLGRGVFRRAVAAEPPDVVVENINKLPFFLAGLTAAPFCVLVNHLFGAVAFQQADPFSAALVWLAERPIPWAYRRAEFQAVSESTRDDLVGRGVPAERVRVIHSGVDSRALRPDPAVLRTVTPTFLYLGRLKRYKRVDLALRALARTRETRADVSLDIAGTGDDRPRLERLAASLGLGDAVRFRGFVGEAEKLRLFRSTWANLYSSPKEGWGMTNIEAAACGTPSLVSDSPGLRDSVKHGEGGFLVPHGDPGALAARMLELAGDPGLVARLGLGARRFAEWLSWERAAEQTEAHLRELVAERRG
ncbi:MAG: glycosyltransferase family 4 protein, partial [Gemmatimonadales bacterium]